MKSIIAAILILIATPAFAGAIRDMKADLDEAASHFPLIEEAIARNDVVAMTDNARFTGYNLEYFNNAIARWLNVYGLNPRPLLIKIDHKCGILAKKLYDVSSVFYSHGSPEEIVPTVDFSIYVRLAGEIRVAYADCRRVVNKLRQPR